MKTRIITALVLLPLLILILLSNSAVVTVAVIILSVVGAGELYRAVGLSAKKPLCALGYTAAVIIPLCAYISKYINEAHMHFFFMALSYAFMLALFVILLVSHKNTTLSDIATLIFSIVYIPYFLTHIIYIREMQFGKLLLWLIVIGAFLTDIGAYFVGVFLGKHKLCPEISPKKTIEGAVGGILGCVIFYMIYGVILEKCFALDVSFLKLAFFGVIISIISQLGDLSASIIKRQVGIKDYGTLFPGHGGILDRCDSIIFVAPAVYILLNIIGIFA